MAGEKEAVCGGLGQVDLSRAGCCRDIELRQAVEASMSWVTRTCHYTIIRPLSPLPVEGMEEGCKGPFRASLRVTKGFEGACCSWKGPYEAEAETA